MKSTLPESLPKTLAFLNKLTGFLNDLDRECISYSLKHHRDESITVEVALPGERWEIEFLLDGSVEIEKFISSGEIYGEASLEELFHRYADQAGSRKPSKNAGAAVLERDLA